MWAYWSYKTDQTTLNGEDTVKELTDEPTTEEAQLCIQSITQNLTNEQPSQVGL